MNYRSGKCCDVTLQPERTSGKFLADGSTLFVVDCKKTSAYFGLAKLGPGPGRDTVTVDIAHADKDTIQTACTKGFPRPKEIFGELGPGQAYVPLGHEKTARFVIDLTTSKAVPEAEFGKP